VVNEVVEGWMAASEGEDAPPSDDVGHQDPERLRLEAVYGAYHASGRDADRWNPEAEGNRCILAERQARMAALLVDLPREPKILEIGCGAGEVLAQIERSVSGASTLVGVDLLADRLAVAARERALGRVAQADGRCLPFEDGEFDLVVMFTVLSSVLDHSLRQELANEAVRVVAAGGAILWYDLRFPSTNRSVRPLSRRHVRSLFPGCTVDVRSTTVVPPLARRLGSWDRVLYPRLARLSILHSHHLGLIRPR
jgi:SAM-dependent methyltransferase